MRETDRQTDRHRLIVWTFYILGRLITVIAGPPITHLIVLIC